MPDMVLSDLVLSDLVLSAIQWDPHIRGMIIVLTAFVVLVGSVYLLLSTNTGPRLGFLIAAAGLFGWMTIMGGVWLIFGIGLKGRQAAWEPRDLITGSVELSSERVLENFPQGWQRLPEGDAILGDAKAAADRALAPSDGEEGQESGAAPVEPEFDPPYSSVDDYVLVNAYRTGGENHFFGFEHPRGFLHKPHYTVIQVQPVLEQDPLPGQPPPTPTADITQPTTNVLLVRDLGSLRFPPFMFTLVSAIFFGVVSYVLHQRDKEVIAARAAGRSTTPATT